MRLLMHICCANCAIYPLIFLKQKNIEVDGFWFNPNIHPYLEYKNRLDALRHLQSLWNLNIFYEDYYGLKEFLRNVVGRENERCLYCYTSRLEETAKKAKEIGADAFTTSLLVSPFQKIDVIIKLGISISKQYSVEFYVDDFRKGYNEGRRIAKELGLYRQKYCGCIYSEMERYKNG
jgi:predicted adenine nucleotide alpha hydrolase (AANH) superfamily ATPase